ncbi:hypothetical protein [Youngiibacter fragilis]|jgi:uncharacterized protein YciI|uniref:YCII-related domain-containing protein n=1 Tax=Youngiibacter fragilis 232.1 TaxID=994573 RepID=V7I3V0_9CLOT|nr:hypothetical protein [Youngiibacter fragilis]ETA79971.1 hypothetical protein T472_0214135 [Youngiibacter fragilis 232.1]
MQKKNGLFVKIQYDMDRKNPSVHSKSMLRDKQSSEGRFMLCGGSYMKNEATMIFNAKTFNDAEYIVNNNPFIKNTNYRFSIYSADSIAANA